MLLIPIFVVGDAAGERIMKLKQLLQKPQFNQIKVVNHKADLSANITTVGMMEAPDIANYVVKGQILVTTGYHFIDNDERLIELIKVMSQKGAAAIGIKEHRYLDHISPKIIDAADQYQFPILLLPDNVRISVVVRDILHAVLEQQTDQLSQIMNDTLYVSKYILAKRSDNEILNQISKLLKLNAFIIDSFGRLKAKNKDAIVDVKLFDYTEHQMNLINLEQPTEILDHYIIYPLKTTNKLTRRFVIFNLPTIENSAQNLLIENMVNLLSLESMQVSINVNDTRQRKSEVFETILSHSMPKESFASSLSINGLDIHDKYQAFAIDEANSIDTGNHQFVMHHVAEYVYWYFNKIAIPIIVITWHFKLFVLIRTNQQLLPILNDLNQFLAQHFPNSQNRIGFTGYEKPLMNFKKLLNESNEALNIAKREKQSTPNKFRPQQVNDILHLVPKNEAVMFIDSVLGPILKMKPSEQEQFIGLLEQYFAENESISRAADELFIHRNTAVYRLKKIEKVLAMDLRDPKDNEQLRLATKLYVIYY